MATDDTTKTIATCTKHLDLHFFFAKSHPFFLSFRPYTIYSNFCKYSETGRGTIGDKCAQECEETPHKHERYRKDG